SKHILFTIAYLLVSLNCLAQINTDQVMRIGKNSLYFEDYILAIQYFNQVIKAKPFLAEPYFYRSVAKITLEDYSGAEEDASQAIERNPFIVDAYEVRGVARQNLRNFAGAIADHDEGLKLLPNKKSFIMNRAVCHAELKNYESADSSYHQLLKLDAKNDKAYLRLAHQNLSRKDTVAALENINQSIQLSKNNSSAYIIRADILMRNKEDYEGALADMDAAITLEPRHASYYINRAYVKYNMDDYFGAMADYDYAIGLDPSTLEGHFNRALLLAEVGDNNKAIDDFSYVLNSHSDNFMALYNRAMLYFRTGQFKKSVADYDAVLAKYPLFEAGYMARGEAKRRMGDRKGGDADYDKALSIFKKKHTHESDFNPVEIEVEAAVKKAEARQNGEEEPETQDEIMNKFNTLLTVAPDNPIKPEYANRQRGHIQNSNVDIEPEPMFLLSFYSHDNKLNGNTYYMKEIAEVNDTRLLPATLSLVEGDQQIDENEISKRFASIEYYNSLLVNARPRAIDYFARGMDYLMVRNGDAAIADAKAALAINDDFTLAHLLLANAKYLKYRMARSGADEDASTDAKTQAMLHLREQTAMLQDVIKSLDDVLKLSPKNVYALYDKGNAFIALNDFTSAISCYSKALEIKPDLAAAYYNRGLMYLRLGNKELGMADLSKAGELGILPSYNVLKRMNN
ncbi:MAG: tetratricopeptide repeat protein, partial [Bacteroidales bacterium]|nr:tetratricopeptide repeat protein [Candidatus Sodaliphilus fimicaballi]